MKKRIKILALIFIIIGLLIVLYPTISNCIITRKGLNAIVNYNNKIEKLSQDKIDEEYQKIINYNNTFCESEYESVLNINGDGIMGYIEIPKISIKLPIYSNENSYVKVI